MTEIQYWEKTTVKHAAAKVRARTGKEILPKDLWDWLVLQCGMDLFDAIEILVLACEHDGHADILTVNYTGVMP